MRKDTIDIEDKSQNIKGLKLKSINWILLVLNMLLVAAFIITMRNLAIGYDEMMVETEDYRRSQGRIAELQQAVDDLSDSARRYVNKGRRKFIEEYFLVRVEDGNRKTIETNFIKKYEAADSSICEELKSAMDGVADLGDYELRALRLTVEAIGADMDKLPVEIRSFELPLEDQSLTEIEKREKAERVMYGTVYVMKEQEVKKKLLEVSRWLDDQAHGNLVDRSSFLGQTLWAEKGLVLVFVLVMGGIFVLVYRMVLNPLYAVIRQIREKKPVSTKGFYEIRYLADAYNDICRLNAVGRLQLDPQTSYDEMTGLLNRDSFSVINSYLRTSLQPVAFLLMDIDSFESINSNYGHETGDLLLKKAAAVIRDSFRNEDYVIRYGDDEFAVLMIGIRYSNKSVISGKIDHINQVMMHPEDSEDLPPLSVSAGVAFSERGYSEDMAQKAAVAVVFTKEHGKCGYTYCRKNMIKFDSQVTR